LQICIVHDVEESSEIQTLFRENSMASKILASYTKLVGVEFLQEVIGPILEKIILSWALTTGGVGTTEVDMDVKLREYNELPRHLENLNKKCQQLLDSILSSYDKLPSTVRGVAHLVFNEVGRKYPSRQRIGIGNFLFLRFICPAIITPESYGIEFRNVRVDGVTRKGLILISKVLQKLANGGRFGSKESFMLPLNDFLDLNDEKMVAYFQNAAVLPMDADSSVVTISHSRWQEDLTGLAKIAHQNLTKVNQNLSASNIHGLDSYKEQLHSLAEQLARN